MNTEYLKEKVLKLYACCIPVKGARRDLICDVQRGRYFFIPHALYTILTEDEGKTVKEIKAKYEEHTPIIEEYVSFLLTNELCFFTDEPERFPKLSLQWRSPHQLTNAILDCDSYSTHNFVSILKQLDSLGCVAVQFRYFGGFTAEAFKEILVLTKTSRFRSFELIIPDYGAQLVNDIEEFISINKRLTTVLVHSASVSTYNYNSERKLSIIYRKEVINSADHCGVIHPLHFRPNLSLFTEAQQYNSCLNRKIGIDAIGNIKNCPTSRVSYGNVEQTTIEDVLKSTSFKHLWSINKDQVKTCKDCEFRYICTDCRVFTVNGDTYEKPSKCNYDPYTATWRDQTENLQSHFSKASKPLV